MYVGSTHTDVGVAEKTHVTSAQRWLSDSTKKKKGSEFIKNFRRPYEENFKICLKGRKNLNI